MFARKCMTWWLDRSMQWFSYKQTAQAWEITDEFHDVIHFIGECYFNYKVMGNVAGINAL